MKILRFAFVFFILAASVVGCKYDDEELWNRVNSLEERIESLESQLTSMNKDISSISTVVNALQNNLSVTSIEETENGYTLTFSDDQKITIKNGTDGEDGNDAPIIGVDLFEGKYYWTQTIDGTKTWLTDAKGNKFPVAGESGVTPRLKVSATGHWMVSYDNGISYTEVLDEKGKPVQAVGKDGEDGEDGKDGHNGSSGSDGKDGDSFFKDVKVDGDELVLVLKDGTEIRLGYTGGSTEIQTTTTKGTVDLEEVEGLKVVSLVDEATLQQKDFTIETIENSLPQLVFVTDEKENIIMMARGYFASQTAEVNAQSTALALVSIMPQLVVKTKEDFEELSQMILSSKNFNAVKEEVNKSIQTKKNLLDEENTTLFQAIDALVNELLEKPQTRAFENIVGIETTPLDVKAEGNTLVMRNIGLAPPYECTVTYGGQQIKKEMIHTPGSYGILDVIKGESGRNHYGRETKFSLTQQGEYNFYCDKTSKEALSRLGFAITSDILSTVGIDGDKHVEDLVDTYTILASTISNLYAGTASIEDLASFSFDLVMRGIEGIGTIIKEDATKTIFQILNVYDKVKGVTHIARRLKEALNAPSFISFNLCYYSEITSCTNVSLTKVEKSDNQTGKPNQALEEPIEVLVSSIAEDGTTILQDFFKVKFDVTSGDGTISTEIASINESGFASTNWTLGTSGAQTLRAVVINEITNTEISEPVIFTAKLEGVFVTTGTATNISATGATLSGTVLSSEEDYSYGISYSTDSDPTDMHRNLVEATSNQNGTFSVTLSSLATGTTYYWCAYAYYNGTYVWGEVKSFTPVGSDRDILVALYEATGGENWVNNTNWCTDAPLSEWYGIEATADGKVTDIDLRNNGLTGAMDLKGLLSLEGFVCDNNQVTSIDLSGCYNLRHLNCYDNLNLTSIDASNCLLLYEVWCNGNTNLTSLTLSNCISLQKINVHENKLTALDVSDLINLEGLICSENQISSLNLRNCKQLGSFSCNDNNLSSLDVSNLKNLTSVACEDNQISSLNVSGCTNLDQISCENNQLTSLDLSGLIALEKIWCTNNDIKTLDVFDASNLGQLYCKDNPITRIRLSKEPSIFEIDYWGDVDRDEYTEPAHKNGYQYPEFIYE